MQRPTKQAMVIQVIFFLVLRVAGAMPSNTAIRGGGEGFQPIYVLLGKRPGSVCVSVCTSVCV